MGVVAPEKAGMGSAVNDATRELGGTLGVAVIGSVALSVYRDHLGRPPAPEALVEPARESIGAAQEAARQAAGLGDLAQAAGEQVLTLARAAFVDGFTTGCVVAGVVTALAGVLTLIYLPAHPEAGQTAGDSPEYTESEPVDDAV